MLEMNHCELGAELAKFWDLPDAIVAVLRYHHDPENEHADIGQPLVSMVNLAEKILAAFGIAEHGETEIHPEEWQALGIDPATAMRSQSSIFPVWSEAETCCWWGGVPYATRMWLAWSRSNSDRVRQ